MTPLDMAYYICRCYVDDIQGWLDEATLHRIRGWIRSRSISKLATCSSYFPQALSKRESARALMQIEAFFKKNSAFANAQVCRAAASKSFFEAEDICRETNQRLDNLYAEHLDDDLSFWLSRATRWIDTVLGDFESFLDELPANVQITAGATATRPRKKSMPFKKVSTTLSCSVAVRPFLSTLAEFFGYGPLEFKDGYWNRVEFVPKNWKTERTIACEPDGNLPLQLAFDRYAKRRLRSRGIDLSDQSLNQRLARDGSISGELATIDMSMASDTVAYNTVAALFPYRWFQYLCATRSAFGRIEIDGETRLFQYEKFSSMGNGSTFAVETLIFAACCWAIGSRRFSVYGDDIIVETELVDNLLRLLDFLGFKVNTEKSHVIGPFRESCGANWYEGVDITPFYLRKWSKSRAVTCHNVNGLAAISIPGGKLEEFLLSLVREEKLPLVPFNLSSTSGIWIDVHTAYLRKLLRHKHGLTRFRAYCPDHRFRHAEGERSLFLWFLDKFQGRGPRSLSLDNAPFLREGDIVPASGVRSRVPIFEHRYVRKWVHWHPPVVAAPVHLYRWTELITRP